MKKILFFCIVLMVSASMQAQYVVSDKYDL